jgi:hypothetical protein
VGADRKGPLAAFVVIAIIAAVLLVTSVRSQAAPGWLDPERVPASVVAAPPVADPHLWAAVTSGVHHVVRGGVVLVKQATSDDSVAEDTDFSLVAATSGTGAPASDPGASGNVVTRHRDHHRTDHGQGPTAPVHHTSGSPAPGHHARHSDTGDDGDQTSAPSQPDRPGHGHHPRSDHGNGHHGNGHHGNGHHGNGHHGNGNGNGHGKGRGRSH